MTTLQELAQELNMTTWELIAFAGPVFDHYADEDSDNLTDHLEINEDDVDFIRDAHQRSQE